jgi:hypothetical protein
MKLKSNWFTIPLLGAGLLACALLAWAARSTTPQASRGTPDRPTTLAAPVEAPKSPKSPSVENGTEVSDQESRNHPELTLQLE